MSIHINSNYQSNPYTPERQEHKAETSVFSIPEIEKMTAREVFDAHAKAKISDEDFSIFQKQWISQARMMPDYIMSDTRLDEFMEANVAKIVYEFGEDGSIRIKDGLSRADYNRAVAGLREYHFWLRGGTLSR